MHSSVYAPVERLDGPGATWIHTSQGGAQFIDVLGREYGFLREDIHACQPVLERPRLLIRPNYAFLVAHFPVHSPGANRFEVAELDAFITPDVLITSVMGKLTPLDVLRERLWRDSRARTQTLASPLDALGALLESCIVDMFPQLTMLHQEIDMLDNTVTVDDYKGSIVQTLLDVRQRVIQLRRMAMGQRAVLTRFQELAKKFGDSSDWERAQHFMRHADEIWQTLESSHEAVDALWQANNAMVSYRTSSIMKTLTMLSVVIFPLTLIATMFAVRAEGMPFVDNPYGFWQIVGILLGVATGMFAYFKYKKWL